MSDTLSIVKAWSLFIVGGLLDWSVIDWTEGVELFNTAAAAVSFTLASIYTFYKIRHLKRQK